MHATAIAHVVGQVAATLTFGLYFFARLPWGAARLATIRK